MASTATQTVEHKEITSEVTGDQSKPLAQKRLSCYMT